MGSSDRKAEEIIEETMRAIFDDLDQSKSMNKMDSSNASHKRYSSHKSTSGKGHSGKKRPGVESSGRVSAQEGGRRRNRASGPSREREGKPVSASGPSREKRRREVSASEAAQEKRRREASARAAAQEEVYEEVSAQAVSSGEAPETDFLYKKQPRKKEPNLPDLSSGGDVSRTGRRKDAEDTLDKRREKKKYPESEVSDDSVDIDDMDDFFDQGEDKKEKMGGKRSRKRKKDKSKKAQKAVLITMGSVAGVLLVTYIGLAMYFNSHFMFFTEINGTGCSMKSVEQVEEEMAKKVSDYKLTLKESGGGSETIAGSDISLKYVPGDKLEQIAKEQNGFLWPKSLWEHPKIETEIGVQYDEAALSAAVAALGCMNPETQTPSVDAHPEFQEGQFVVAPEVIGTQINAEVMNQKVAEAISGFKPTLDLSETGCYALPRFVSDSPEVTAAAAAMNGYLGANVTYDFNPNTEVVDASVISQWVKVDGDMNVTFDEGAVRAYVQSLADKYNTKGVPRPFTTASGNVVTVEGGGFGWRIDQEAEYAALLANIQNGETVTREPNYSSRGISHGGTDVGSTYAEVDLTNQRMYFIKDGQVVLQSDCVTGNPNKGHATPQGYYSLAWKQKNRTLRGEKQPDGTYEYETPVAFWMPFNGGIGFHDATWQSSFGGRRYQTHGSHGCVNLPYSIAKQLYDLMYDGVPVVCHY